MDKYIKCEAGLAMIRPDDPNDERCAVTVETAKRLIRHALTAAPAADVAPVVHGRWSDAGFGELPKHAPYGWACSVCGGISFNNEYIYCPNCGAKMDGGADHAAD